MIIQDERTKMMFDFYREIFQMKTNNKHLYRHLKIQRLSRKIPTPKIEHIKKANFFFKNKYWKIIEKVKPYSIITGSLALKAFGFLERKVEDLDFILLDKSFALEFEVSDKKFYDDNYHHNLINTYRENSYSIDIYDFNGQDFIELDDIKYQNPYEILLAKLDLVCLDGHTKHFMDLKFYFEHSVE